MKMFRMYKHRSFTEPMYNLGPACQTGDGSVTLNTSWQSTDMGETTTPFKEVKVVPHINACGINNLLDLFTAVHHRRDPVDVTALIDSLFEYAERKWDPHATNVLYHSSGWDSRILGSIIKHIRDRKGGRLVIACMTPEWDLSRPIIHYQGFHDNAEVYFYDRFKYENFKFKDIWKQISGPCEHPFNVYYTCMEWLRNKGIISRTDNVHLWHGVFFNETYMEGQTFNHFLRRWYYARIAKFLSPLGVKWHLPALDDEHVRILFNGACQGEPLREEIVRRIDPRLHAFHRRGHPEDMHIPQPVLTKAVADYKASWFYANVKPRPSVTPTASIERRDSMAWWSRWTLASLVDHLVEKGVIVNVG